MRHNPISVRGTSPISLPSGGIIETSVPSRAFLYQFYAQSSTGDSVAYAACHRATIGQLWPQGMSRSLAHTPRLASSVPLGLASNRPFLGKTIALVIRCMTLCSQTFAADSRHRPVGIDLPRRMARSTRNTSSGGGCRQMN